MKRFVCLIVLFFSLSATAQQNNLAPNNWQQEPVSFLGIKFGQPVRASLVECPKVTEYGSTRYQPVGFGHACFEPIAGFYDVRNLNPFISVYVNEINGNVESVSAKFNNGNSANLSGIDANGIAATLVDKFGAAHSNKVETVRTKAGVAYENRVLFWKGRNVTIEFESVAGEYDHGLISAYTSVFVAYSAKQQSNKQNALKDVF